MKSPAHALALYLADFPAIGTFAAATGWSIAVSTEPVSPDTAITLYDSPAGEAYFADADISQPMLQVRTRARDYEEAYTKQNDIKAILSNVMNQQIDDAYYIGVWLKSEIICIGRDDNDRFLFTANYRVERQSIGEEST